MKVRITSIADQGNYAKERIVMRALSPIDIGKFAIFEAEKSKDGGVTNAIFSTYWFPDKKIKTGDLIVLYTKSGTSGTKELSNGRLTHFFYWSEDVAKWSTSKRAPVLLAIDDWYAYLDD